MKFRFPIFIIDEDYRSENASGLGIRALSAAIEAEGVEVIGVTSYGDLSSFAQQQSRASASSCRSTMKSSTWTRPRTWPARSRTCAPSSASCAFATPTSRSTCTARRARPSTSRTTSCASCTASSTCSRTRPSSWRAISSAKRSYVDSLPPPFFRELVKYAQDGSYSWHCPGHSGGVAFLKSPWARCSTSSSARTCCAPTSATPWMNWASCWTTPARWPSPS